MFSGIVEDKGKIVSFKEGVLTVHSNLVLEDLKVKVNDNLIPDVEILKQEIAVLKRNCTRQNNEREK